MRVSTVQSHMAKPSVPLETNIQTLQDLMRRGKLSSESLTRHYLERIRTLDKGKLNSVLETNPDALRKARSLDAERASGQTRGALHGVPVLVKDNVDTATGCTPPPVHSH
jgi:amidase